jgi:hypothetical protein
MNRACAALLALLAIGCSDDSTGAGANHGTLRVELTSPNSGLDGAAVVVLTGPAAPRSVTAATGLTLWGAPVTTTPGSVAVTGVLSTGAILTLEVDDVTLVSQYSATLREVAAHDTTVALRALAGYSLTVVR